MRTRNATIFVIPILAMFASGCVSQQYVAADRATFKALTPSLNNYINGVPCPLADVQPIKDAISGWDARTTAAEGATNGPAISK